MLEAKLYKLLYDIIKQNVDQVKGNICVPISGGLDSRVIAGYMQKMNRPIDLVITFGNPGDKHVNYAKRIARSAGYKGKIITASVTQQEIEQNNQIVNTITGLGERATPGFVCLQKIDKRVDLSEYTFLIPYGLDWLTGIKINPLTFWRGSRYFQEQDHYFVNTYYHQICLNAFKVFHFFGAKAINPIWYSESLFQFCSNLPLKERFHQRLFRSMIKEYFTKLAAIPRTYMDCGMDCNEFAYFIHRTLYFLKKKLNKNEIRY